MLRNLGSAMQGIVERHHATAARIGREVAAMAAMTRAHPVAPDTLVPRAVRHQGGTGHARRQAQLEEVRRLHTAGVSLSLISRQIGRDRKTLRGWLQADAVPLWRQPLRGSVLDPYRGHLERRWAEGCRNAARLGRELTGMGYQGRYTLVRAWAAIRCRTDGDGAWATSTTGGQPWRPPTGRRLARLITVEADALAEPEQSFVVRLLAQVPALASAAAVARRLSLRLRRRSDEALQDVLAAADGTLLAGFAAELRKDGDAVQAALDTPWTTSPVEGQISRLKMLKRSMYGRAGFDLLRARVLAA